MSTGIDYGMGKTNIDKETGIRFGVISQNELLQTWCDSAEAVYPEPEDANDYEGDESFVEPLGHRYTEDGYRAYQHGDDTDLWVEKSPYFTLCKFCSPCAPGAGYLMTPGDVKAYCFGHDWFEDNKAPYKVFSVETGLEVPPEGGTK